MIVDIEEINAVNFISVIKKKEKNQGSATMTSQPIPDTKRKRK